MHHFSCYKPLRCCHTCVTLFTMLQQLWQHRQHHLFCAAYSLSQWQTFFFRCILVFLCSKPAKNGSILGILCSIIGFLCDILVKIVVILGFLCSKLGFLCSILGFRAVYSDFFAHRVTTRPRAFSHRLNLQASLCEAEKVVWCTLKTASWYISGAFAQNAVIKNIKSCLTA
jgi:hypothetical protein